VKRDTKHTAATAVNLLKGIKMEGSNPADVMIRVDKNKFSDILISRYERKNLISFI